MSYFTISTGHGVFLSTPSLTLPMKIFFIVPSPLAPITMRSKFPSLDFLTISPTASPPVSSVSTETFSDFTLASASDRIFLPKLWAD